MNSVHDADQFMSLLEPLKDSLYRFARRNAWGSEMAADIVQEAIMTGWREFERFELGTNFRSWMFQILVNTVYRLNKRWRRHSEPVPVELADDLNDVLDREDAWVSILENPERVLESLDDRMVEALDGLMPVERQCLLLRLLEDFSYREMANMLDIPMGTAMSHVHRGRMKLREQLAEMALENRLVGDPATAHNGEPPIAHGEEDES